MPRINVYHHEVEIMQDRPELVTKEAEGRTYHGVRFYTEPPREHLPGDDDSAAVTLWAPWSRGSSDTMALRNIADHITRICDQIDSGKAP